MINLIQENSNIPFESKRNSDCPYWYIFKHGIGPGTIPDDVKIGKVKDLDNYYSIVWLDRPLSTQELKYYDIYPETMNRQILKGRLGYSDAEIDNLVGEKPVQQKRIDTKNIINPFDECNENLQKEMYHHIDNGYSAVKPDYRSILINDFWIDFVGTIDEMTDSFYFEEDEQGGFGNVQFFGMCKLSGSGSNNPKVSGDFIKFRWWFNVNLVGDVTDETKIYLEIDNSLIESDLFEYELDNTNMIEDKASDFLYNNAYDIGEFIWNVIQANATGFGYSI